MILLATFATASVSAKVRFSEPGWFGDLGLEGDYYAYQEKINGRQFFMNDKGAMYGLYYAFGYQPKCTDFRFAIDGRIVAGSRIHYKSASSGTLKNSHYTITENRLLGFYPWQLDNTWIIEGYTGIGNRHANNDDRGLYTSTNAYTYLRHSQYTYIPIGMRVIKELANDLSVATHLEYDWFLSGTQKSYFQGMLNNRQRHGYGVRAGVDVYIPSCYTAFNYMIGAFVRHWNIKDSTVNISTNGRFVGYEPKNRTTELGIRFGLVF